MSETPNHTTTPNQVKPSSGFEGEEITSKNYDEEASKSGWDSPKRAQELVKEYVTKGSTVVDIGIGTGQAVEGYSEKGAYVIGIDHDPEMLQKAQSIIGQNGRMIQADINGPLNISGFAGEVDVAQAIGSLEFAKDLDATIEKVGNLLKTAGVFVFTVETADDASGQEREYFPNAEVTVYRHSSNEIRDILQSKGLLLLFDEAYDGYSRDDKKVPYHIFLAQKI